MGKLIAIITMITLGLTGCKAEKPVEEMRPAINQSGEVSENSSTETLTMKDDFEILKYMTDDENYMISPFSLKMAMMLAANGAEGETLNEILKTFGIEDVDLYNAYAKSLIEKYNLTNDVNLNVANSIWLNKDVAGNNIEFKDSYKEAIEKYYYGKTEVENAKEITFKVNDWIEEKTNNKIKDMLDEEKEAEFLALLVNTIYFKGQWMEQFNEHSTRKDTFTDRNARESEIDFMNMTKRFSFYEDENMKMVRLPYEGNETAMYMVLPIDEDKMDIKAAIEKMDSYKVKLSIPKFKVEYDFSFKDTLKEMGIGKAFEKYEAEFKNKMFEGVDSGENVYVEDVLQKTFIDVDEKGTEAAAATVVVMNKVTSIRPEEEIIKEFKADKPFIYFIMDEETKEVLFLGEYAFAE